MKVYLVNPADLSFGVSPIIPRWMYVLAGATPAEFGTPVLCDELLEKFDPQCLEPGDVVGIGIHTLNARRGYEVGRAARARGARVIYGGAHATLLPAEPPLLGGAHAVVKGEADRIWCEVLADCAAGSVREIYGGGLLEGSQFEKGRWDLVPRNKYLIGSVQTARGCPNHCSFCSVWRIDGNRMRVRPPKDVVEEVAELRKRGFRYIMLADDNFYPASRSEMERAAKTGQATRVRQLEALREERLQMLSWLSALPADIILCALHR